MQRSHANWADKYLAGGEGNKKWLCSASRMLQQRVVHTVRAVHGVGMAHTVQKGCVVHAVHRLHVVHVCAWCKRSTQSVCHAWCARCGPELAAVLPAEPGDARFRSLFFPVIC